MAGRETARAPAATEAAPGGEATTTRPPLVLVINAEPAADFREEVENSPAVLRELRDEKLVQVEALPRLLSVCWVPPDDATGGGGGGGLEDVGGLKKNYMARGRSVQGLEILASCLCMLAQDGEVSENKALLRTGENDQAPSLYVPSGEDLKASALRDLAAGKLSRETQMMIPLLLGFAERARLSSAHLGPRLVEIVGSSGIVPKTELKQKLLLRLQTARDKDSRVVQVRDASSSRIVSVLLAVGPADAAAVRKLLPERQKEEGLADEAEYKIGPAAEIQPVQISFVVHDAGDGGKAGLGGDLELTVPPLPDDEDERASLASELLTRDDAAPLVMRKARAWEQLARHLAASGLRLHAQIGARVTMSRDAGRDGKLAEAEKPSVMCVVVTIPADAVRSEVPRGQRLVDAQPDVTHPEQREVANELFRKAKLALLGPGKSDLAKRFLKVSFVILTPNFSSLHAQTAIRVTRVQLDGGRVLKYTKVPRGVMNEHREWMESEAADPGTLLVIIADECHFAPTLSGAHDWLLNNESLTGENVLRLLVSATPQNVLSSKSRIADANVVRWFTEDPLYRSMDYYVETATWAVPDCVQPLELRVGGKTYFVDARVRAPVLGHAFRYPMHKYKAFCEVFSAAVRQALPYPVSQGLPEGKSFFCVVGAEERLQMAMPVSVEISESGFRAGSGLLHWLGFGDDLEDAQLSRGQALDDSRTWCYTIIATKLPLFCDTKANAERKGRPADCLPRRRQRVRKDGVFDSVRSLVSRTFGKRGDKMRREMRVAPSTPLLDGHISMADYLLSLVYLSVYRVDHANLWGKDLPRDDIFRALAPEDIGPLSLDDGLLFRFAQHLGFVQKLWPDFLDNSARQVGTFDIAGGLERASVQHVLDKLLDAMFATAWSELETPDVRDALRGRLGDGWVNNLQTHLCGDEHDTPGHWRFVWQYIISGKLTSNREDSTNGQGSHPLPWYSETDRLLHDLLDIDPRYRTGRMAVIRVHETDEHFSIRDGLRSALAKLGLTSREHGGLLSVVADVGGSDGRMTAPNEARRPARRATNLFTQLEAWALERDLRHPSKQERAPDDSETILDRVQRTFVEAREREVTEQEPQHLQKMATYEDLENLPTIVIMCEKRRLGYTFPHSFRFLDLRLRRSPTSSTFVQEVGCVCRYPGLDDDKAWRFEVRVASESAMQDDGDDGVDWSSLDDQLDAFSADPDVAAFFARGGSYALLNPGNEVRFHVDSELQLRSRLRAALQAGHQPRARLGTWTAKRYTHVPPTVLMSRAGFNKPLQAVEHKYRDAQGHQRIDQCLPGPLNFLLSRNKKAKRPSIRLENGEVLVTNPLHDFEAYHTCQVQSKSSQREKDESTIPPKAILRPTHYDSAQDGETDPRRLLLTAPCRQGTTGAYLHFVRLLKDHIELAFPAPPDPLPPVPKADWVLPYWANLVVSAQDALRSSYDKPREGQDHATAMQQRMLALMLACETRGKDWVHGFVTEYLLSGDGEAIKSQAGLERAVSLAMALAAAGPPVKAGGEMDLEVAFKCINFDGRFSAPEWTSTIKDLITDGAAVKALAAAVTRGAQRGSFLCLRNALRAGGILGKKLREPVAGTPSSSTLTSSMQHRRAYESVASRSITPSFDGRYCFKQHILVDIDLVGRGVRLSAPYDGFHGLSVHADAGHVQVILKPVAGGTSSPLLVVEMAEKNCKVTTTSAADSVRWIFVPSYNHAGGALLDYDRAIPVTDGDKPTVVCIVVCSGKQFDDYVAAYGSAHLILGMPPFITWNMRNANPEVRADLAGTGYARRFIQRAAHELGLPWVWILDDNVDVCYQRELCDGEVSADAPRTSPKACTFAEVMSGVERIVHEQTEAVITPPEQRRMENGRGLIRSVDTPPPASAEGMRTKADLTGGADKYGLIGIRCDGQARISEPDDPFTVTNAVHSFVYLNVASTMAHRVYVPVKTSWGDVEFNHLLDEAGLVCLKVNRFFCHKKDLEVSSGNAAARARAARQYHFPQLETALERFRDDCGSLTPTELMSERPVDVYPSTHRWAAAVRDWVDREGAGHGTRSPGATSVPLAVPVYLLERADVSALNTLAHHLPAKLASTLLLVVRDEDIDDFKELTLGHQENFIVAHRSGVTLHVHLEARADGPIPTILLLVGTDTKSPVECEAWEEARRLQGRASANQASTSLKRPLAVVPDASVESKSVRSPTREPPERTPDSTRIKLRRKGSAGSEPNVPTSGAGQRKGDAPGLQDKWPSAASKLLEPLIGVLDQHGRPTVPPHSADDARPASDAGRASDRAKSVSDTQPHVAAASLLGASHPQQEAPASGALLAGDHGPNTDSARSRETATLGAIRMNASIRSRVMSLLKLYEAKDARIPPSVFEHARGMATECATFGDFRQQLGLTFLQLQLKAVAVLDAEAEEALRKALNALKMALNRSIKALQQVGGTENAHGAKPLVVPRPQACLTACGSMFFRTSPAHGSGSATGLNTAKRARSESLKDVTTPISAAESPKGVGWPQTGGATSARTTILQPVRICPATLTPGTRDLAVRMFTKSAFRGRFPKEFADHILRALMSPSNVTSQDVFDQITQARVNEPLRSVPAEHRRTKEDYRLALAGVRSLLRRAFGILGRSQKGRARRRGDVEVVK